MSFLEEARRRVVVLDGAMGTMLHSYDLPLDDYRGLENCSEVLNITRPDVVREIHGRYFEVGADAVETNTFGANKIVLAEFDLVAETYEINRRACEIAREACEKHARPGAPRWVVGSVGPGTKLVTLGQIDYDRLFDSYAEQMRGLVDGGADVILIETCQDILQTKCAIAAAQAVFVEKGRVLPIMSQVTIETTGTMLVGTDIEGAAAALSSMHVDVMGMNCATGPQEMSPHVRTLSHVFPGLVSVLPNAGLPQLVDGRPYYPLSPQEMASWIERFVREDGVSIVGGCCGTGPDHIAAVVRAVRDVRPAPRRIETKAKVSSLYSATALRQDASVLMIGERTNANGSRQFKRLLEAGDVDGMVKMARSQVKEGSHVLDVCTAYVGRDESADMGAVIKRFRSDVTVPLMIDSTEAPVIEAALKLIGGKCIINSINLEDGEERLRVVLPMARRFGAAVVALTIDEQGMAKTAARKLEVAKRLYDLSVSKYGLDPADLIFDPLTFTICTGNEDDRRLAVETLDAIATIAREFPQSHILLGLSNVSFGVDAEIRHALNSVFLYHAQKAGLTAAIVHAAKIEPLHKIEPEVRQVCEDLIFDRRREGYDPLQKLLGLFQGTAKKTQTRDTAPKTIEEKLKQRIIDGDRAGLDADLETALLTHPPLDIINDILLDGMKVVGDLFGAGEMQLPFVLQSAETMKAAVAWLEPKMDKSSTETKGKIVLATVKGDVHDIGKNLVDIILTNNGFTCVNLGINQTLSKILEAVDHHRPDAIGLSGLLVKSTVIMRENLEELVRQDRSIPVILGGAALTRKYVEDDCRRTYTSGTVFYAKDSFEGLRLMSGLCTKGASAVLEEEEVRRRAQLDEVRSATPATPETGKLASILDRPAPEPLTAAPAGLRRDVSIPEAPFFGTRVIDRVALRALVPYVNESMLFHFQWQYKRQGRSGAELDSWLRDEIRPVLRRLLDDVDGKDIICPQAVYGYFPCNSEGDDVVIFEADGRTERTRFTFPRQRSGARRCIADYFAARSSGRSDVIALMAVTIGQNASDVERAWFKADRYTDYFHLHGLSVEAAEALAEYLHRQIRTELGIAAADARDMKDIFRQGYQGSRFSFGYPACPNLEDQSKILELLDAGRIGITLSEEFQLHPEQSTTALVVHHPDAKYFSLA